MKLAGPSIYALKLLQTGTIGGLIGLPLIHRAYEFDRSSLCYQAAEQLWNAGMIVGLIALAASLTLVMLPKACGTRKRGGIGIAVTLGLFVLDALLMPIILPG